MDSVLASYGRDFNKKYPRKGSIWREPYASRWISNREQGARTLAYVTLNHEVQRERYLHTSHDYYTGARHADWIDVNSGLAWFGGDRERYREYVMNEGYEALERKILARDSRRRSPRRGPRRGPANHIARN